MKLNIEAGSNVANLLNRCEKVANISGAMLDAARRGEWDEVERLTSFAGIFINEVRVLSIGLTLTAEERKLKLVCMQRILANEAKIRDLSEPWLKRVARWLPGAGNASAGGQIKGMLG